MNIARKIYRYAIFKKYIYITNKKQVKCVLIDLIYVFCNMWGNNTKYQAQDLVDFFIDKIFSKKKFNV